MSAKDNEFKLDPCPFCGKEDLAVESQPSPDGTIVWYRIIHFATSSCGVSLTDTNLKHLIEQWNNRKYEARKT